MHSHSAPVSPAELVAEDVRLGRYSAEEASLYAKPNDTHDLAEKLVELLDDPERRAEMGRYGRERIESTLNWSYQIDSLIGAYKRVAEK